MQLPALVLETDRLWIFPLSPAQLALYAVPGQALEAELGLQPHPREVPDALKEAFEESILPAVAQAGEHYLFSTLWTAVGKANQTMVGDVCFQGSPNEQGEIEIGYGSHDAFRGQGFMSEAVGALVGWAFRQPDVQAVIAETDPGNIASRRILEKNGFRQTGVNGPHLCWKLEKSKATD